MANSIEIRLEDVSQLFETMDPFPSRDRELAREADAYIFDWAHELPRNQPLEITIHLPASAAQSAAVRSLDKSLANFFTYRARIVGRELSDLFRMGRRTLMVGLAVLAACLAIGQTLAALVPDSGVAHFFEEGLIIVGWVALWRPLEIFLYDWWPIAQNRKRYRRLAGASVRVQFYNGAETSGAGC